jgi:hypothetical protein
VGVVPHPSWQVGVLLGRAEATTSTSSTTTTTTTTLIFHYNMLWQTTNCWPPFNPAVSTHARVITNAPVLLSLYCYN